MGMLFVVASLWSGILEQQYLGNESAGVLFSVMDTFDSLNFSNPLSAGWSLFVGTWAIIKCAFQMLLWDYAFFTGYYIIFRVLLITISVSIIISLVMALKGASGA
jgi:hypothetical protein